MQTHLSALSLGIRVVPFPGMERREHLYKGNIRPAFRQIRGGQRTLPASADYFLQLKIILMPNWHIWG